MLPVPSPEARVERYSPRAHARVSRRSIRRRDSEPTPAPRYRRPTTEPIRSLTGASCGRRKRPGSASVYPEPGDDMKGAGPRDMNRNRPGRMGRRRPRGGGGGGGGGGG